MRRVYLTKDVIASVPDGAHVEILTTIKDKGTRSQYLPVSALNSAVDALVVSDRLAFVVAGNSGSVIATADGLDTGLILETETAIDITSSVNTKLITLPDGQPHGKIFYLYCIANGVDVVSANVLDDLNGVLIGATNGAPLTAAVVYTLWYDGFNMNWVCTGLTAAGVVETPITPVAL